MKKILLTLAVAGMAFVADAQSKFEVKDFGKFKLHTYITADPFGRHELHRRGQQRSRCIGTCRIS